MNPDLKRAVLLLKEKDYTCIIQKDEISYTSRERGVKPLLDLLDDGIECCDFSAADKVVGKAAAFLYILLRVRAVYAVVISNPALQTLKEHGIDVFYETCVDAIKNRAGTGFCPMESAVWNESLPNAALVAIRKRLAELRKA